MKKYKSIIQRCKECSKVFLISENHECDKFINITYDDMYQMIIEILKSGPKVREDISKILNKTVGRIAFTRYIVEWRLEQKPEMFVKDENGLWNLKTCEVLA